MQLRKIVEQDYEGWLQLWHGYQEFYKVNLSPELSQLTFLRLLHEKEEMGCFVIEQEQELIGLVHYIFHRSTHGLKVIIAIFRISLLKRTADQKG